MGILFSLSACSKSSWLNSETCNQLEGWSWSSDIGACVSKDLTDNKGMYSWNGYGTFFSHGNDESPKTYDNPTPEVGTTYAFVDFECVINKNSDSLQERMSLAANFEWGDLFKILDENNDLKYPTALAVADCIDGVKDLDFSTFEDGREFKPNWSQDEINKRNCYLGGEYKGESNQNLGQLGLDAQCAFYSISNPNQTWAWKQPNLEFKVNSHLPTPWEFQSACGKEVGDAFDLTDSKTYSWAAAVGHISGADWSFGARTLGKDNCEKQNFEDTGAINDIYGFRVVVRP